MKVMVAVVAALFFNLSSHAMEGYDKLNFEFDFNFFSINEINHAFGEIADIGWRALRYDSNAYIKAKGILKDTHVRRELILALLLVEKYPEQADSRIAFDWLMKEIEISKQKNESVTNMARVIDAVTLEKTHGAIRSLSFGERRAIISNILEKTSILASSEISTSSACEIEIIEAGLKDMLKAYVSDIE